MANPISLVDAFADGPFTGNPAAICILEKPADDTWMQRVAMEMNQAETAFLHREEDAYRLRWFTPAVEVDLCGHATLAAAHVLFGLEPRTEILRFQTRSGLLTAARHGEEIELDFPSEMPSRLPLAVEQSWLPTPVWTGANRMDWFAQIESPSELRSLKPDFHVISQLGKRGLIVTAVGDEGFDFVSRCFFPQSGIDEDPVTGSAHCALAPFWAERLGQNSLSGYQASRRGGRVGVEVAGDRVKLRGKALTTVEGCLLA